MEKATIYDITTDSVTDNNTAILEPTLKEMPSRENDFLEGTPTIILYVNIGLFGVVGNSFAIYFLCRSRSMRKKLVNIFLINQSVIDLVTSIVMISIGYFKDEAVIVTMSDKNTTLFCKMIASRVLLWCLVLSSTWNLVFVNIERFISIKFPIFHKTKITKGYISGIVAFTWLFGPIVKFPLVYMTSGYKFGHCVILKIWPSKTVAVATGILNVSLQFFVPLIIMILCYLFMIRSIKSKVSDVDNQAHSGGNKTSRNVFKTLAILTIICIVCWAPHSVLHLLYLSGVIKSFSNDFYHFSVYIFLLNSCINPVIYSAQYKDFQRQVKRAFCKSSAAETSTTAAGTNSTNSIPRNTSRANKEH